MLLKTPKCKEMADTDVFAFNNKFTDRQRKIKMSLLVTKVIFSFMSCGIGTNLCQGVRIERDATARHSGYICAPESRGAWQAEWL